MDENQSNATQTTLFGLTADEWLTTQHEHRRFRRALEEIGSSDVRGKRKALQNIALEALRPDQDVRLTRVLLRHRLRLTRR